jgi:hypothetical protein
MARALRVEFRHNPSGTTAVEDEDDDENEDDFDAPYEGE